MTDEQKNERMYELAGELVDLSAAKGCVGETFDFDDGKALVVVMHGKLARKSRDDLRRLLELINACQTCGNA